VSSDIVSVALGYAHRGWPVLPLHGIQVGLCTCGSAECDKPGKHPRIRSGKGHSAATLDQEKIDVWWKQWPTANVAIRTGAPSGLVVLDVDTAHGGESSLTTLLGEAALPVTPVVRTGSGGRHIYFAHPARRIRNAVGLRPGLDLRGDGGYVVAPPSLHASGGRYEWILDPDRVQLAAAPTWLLCLVEQPNSALRTPATGPLNGTNSAYFESALRGECDQVRTASNGTRNDALNRAAFSLGQVLGAGRLERERTQAELLKAALCCGLSESEARRTIASGLEGGERQRREIDHRDHSGARPTIVVRKRIAAVTDEAEAALHADPESAVYVRSRTLVHVSPQRADTYKWLKREDGAPTIEPISRPYLRELLDRAAYWESARGHQMLVPSWVSETLLARADWPFRRLVDVVETPTLRPDGSVIERPGYDEATGILYHPREAFPSLPDLPSKEDASKAALRVLDLFQDFPFTGGEQGLSATLATVLTLVGRHAICGCAPLFPVRSPTGGTGKGLLADVVAIIGTGRAPARMTVGRDDEETRKRILAIGLNGAPVVLLDNVDHSLGSESLAAALTSEFFEDRLLGASKIVRVPMRAVWFATGNGLTFRTTLGRRVVPIDLDAKMEFPEERHHFRYPNLVEHVRSRRPELAMAALTILAAFFRAGCPEHARPPMGSFEQWDRLIRGACIWLGLPDPCSGRERVREDGDSDLELIRALFSTWHEVFRSEPTTLAQAKAKAEERHEGELRHPDFHAALSALDPRGDGSKLNSRPIGDRLRQWKGKIAEGFTLTSEAEKRHGATAWRVVGESG